MQIPKAQKKTFNLTAFLRFWDLRVKAAHRTLMKLTQEVCNCGLQVKQLNILT
jgi:hypothetical protein